MAVYYTTTKSKSPPNIFSYLKSIITDFDHLNGNG